MPIDKRAGSAAEALADVSDGATVLISGFGGAGFPNILIRALRDRGPKNLTLVVNSAVHRYSFTHELIEAGLVRKVVCTAARGHSKEPSPFERLWIEGKIELECVPQGTFAEPVSRPSIHPSALEPISRRERKCAILMAETVSWRRPSREIWLLCARTPRTDTAIWPFATHR